MHRRTPQADSDLEEIWHYVATESASNEIADRLIDSITRRFLLLSRYPHIGRAATMTCAQVCAVFWSAATSFFIGWKSTLWSFCACFAVTGTSRRCLGVMRELVEAVGVGLRHGSKGAESVISENCSKPQNHYNRKSNLRERCSKCRGVRPDFFRPVPVALTTRDQKFSIIHMFELPALPWIAK